MNKEAEAAIMRCFPREADMGVAWTQLEYTMARMPETPSTDALGELIAALAPVYSQHVRRKITLTADCDFPVLVNAVARGRGWSVSDGAIREIAMRQRPPAAQGPFGKATP